MGKWTSFLNYSLEWDEELLGTLMCLKMTSKQGKNITKNQVELATVCYPVIYHQCYYSVLAWNAYNKKNSKTTA